MLTSKLMKKYPNDSRTQRIIDGEVQLFINNTNVTKDAIKSLEVRISRRLDPTLRQSVDFSQPLLKSGNVGNRPVAQSISVTPSNKLALLELSARKPSKDMKLDYYSR